MSDQAATWDRLQNTVKHVRSETARVIVGQDEIVEQLLTSLLCKGHCLLVGVPGLAKTLLVSTIAKILGNEPAARLQARGRDRRQCTSAAA